MLGGEIDRGGIEGVALGDPDLGADDVEAGEHFGDGMLNLDTGVHLDEEPFVGVGIEEEFDGAGVVVADFASEADGGVAEGDAGFVGEIEGRGDFDDFLVAALDGAIALVEMEDVAVAVADDLDFDVFGAGDVAFEEDGGISEGERGFVAGFFEEAFEVFGFVDDAHSAAAASESGFDDEGEADFLADLEGGVEVGDWIFGAGEGGDFDFFGGAAGGGFVAHHFEKIGLWADESDAGFGAGAGEFGVFGEESVTGMDHVDAFFEGEGDDAFDVEVGGDGAFSLADQVGFVGFEAVDGVAVLVGVDGDGAEAEFVRGTEDANGDFTAVGDEDLLHFFDRSVSKLKPKTSIRKI